MEVIRERAKLIAAIEGIEDQNRSDLQQALDNLREELENKNRDECEKVKLESKCIVCINVSVAFFSGVAGCWRSRKTSFESLIP